MYSNIVLTGGKSAIVGKNVCANYIKENNIENINNIDMEKIDEWVNKVKEALRDHNKEYTNISVEYSLIKRLKDNKKLSESPRISLIHTNTKEGIAAAKINKIAFERDFNAEVTLKGVDFDIDDRFNLNKQLGEFMDILVVELQKGTIYDTFFSPTPGYKVMSYLGYVAGSFYGYKMGYLYEEKPVLQEIPSMPIKFNVEEIVEFLPLIKKIESTEVKLNDLTYIERNFIEENTYLFDIIDNFIILNAFGVFLLKGILKTEVYISDFIKDMITKNPDKTKFIKSQILEMMRKIQKFKSDNNSYKGELMHNKSWKVDKPYLYKASRDPFRAIWDFKENKIYLYYIWFDHDKYEREYTSKNENILNNTKFALFEL
ncbi:hypothetical protein JCM30566_18770 [Marinitoga arctica]